ncbi:SHOCT-like domain-containing protein [Dethiothermospora halolimnae]|uniref:SHOCT-like domain-containing protein n=1 Tax=Dethiothermospora halolimnae TaxID=3114390 RepID=UPI003CCBB4B1
MSNNLKEEKLAILNMIETGKITSEEGIELLNAIEEKKGEYLSKKAKWLKIKVFDPEDDTKVNVNVPIALVDIGLKFATKMSPDLKESSLEEIDFKELSEAIKNGAEGKIVDIDTGDGERVEIIVE